MAHLVARRAAAVFPALVVAGITSGTSAGAQSASASPAPSPSAPTASPSAIPNHSVPFLTVSPAYLHTGLVVAVAQDMTGGCKQNCVQLWVTHNGGASWNQVAGTNWQHGWPSIVVDGHGREVLIAGMGNSGVQRSTDDGATWTNIGPAGTPSVLPSFAHDGGIAVAAYSGGKNTDFILTNGGTKSVNGSGASAADLGFAIAPSFPSAGSYAPALLSAVDPHSSTPEVLRCDADLSCSGTFVLPGNGPMAGQPTLRLSPAYASDGIALAYTATMLYRSTDGGTTFSTVPIGDTGTVATAVTMATFGPGANGKTSDRTAYASITEIEGSGAQAHTAGGVYRSTDGGATWSHFAAGSSLDDGASSLAVAPDGRIFAGYLGIHGSGLLCDSGHAWQATCPSIFAGSTHNAGNGSSQQCTVTACTTASADSTSNGAAGAAQTSASSTPDRGTADSLRPIASSGTHGNGPWAWVAVGLAILLAAAAVARWRWSARRGVPEGP